MRIATSRLVTIVALLYTFSSFPLIAQNQASHFTVQFSPTKINWNPHHAYTTTEAQVLSALHEGLVVYHPATLRPIPGAAETWQISEDRLSITFLLRKNLLWSNGDILDAYDFRDSLLTSLSPEISTEYASLLDDIKGAQEYRNGHVASDSVGIKVLDPQTLVIELRQPSPQFLSILCHYTFAPVHKDFRTIRDWSAHRSVPVSGPYIIRAWNNEEVLLDKNPYYWDKDAVSIEALRFLFLDSADAIMEAFNRHRIDWVVTGMDNTQLSFSEALNVSPLFSTTYYYFSNQGSVWSLGKVRRALALLLPWEEIYAQRLIPGTSLVPPMPDYPEVSAEIPAIEKRRDEALVLLDEAGYPEGRGLPALRIRVPSENSITSLMETVWKEDLNLDVVVEIQEHPQYYDSLKEGGYDLATLTWTGDYADPQTFLGMWRSGSSFNDAAYSNTEYDSILADASTLNYQERLNKLQEAEKILLTSFQVLPIEHFPAVNLIDRRFVGGWFPNALDIHPFKNLVQKWGFDIPGVALNH